MTNLIQIKEKLAHQLLSTREQLSLKGKGMGNMFKKEGKNCPPPVDQGKKDIDEKFF